MTMNRIVKRMSRRRMLATSAGVCGLSLPSFLSLLQMGSSGAGKIELVCDGKASNFKDNIMDVDVKGSVVVVNFETGKVNITGALGGEFLISKVTDERVLFFAPFSELEFEGGINRYTGELIVHNKWDKAHKLLYHLELNCKAAKRLF